VGIFTCEKEMVAGPVDHHPAVDGITADIGRNFIGALHLYVVLMKEKSRVKVLETMLVLALALGIVYWFTQQPIWLLVAMILAVIGLFIPWLAEKIHVVWMKMAQGMGFVMNKVILTVIYVIVLMPLSLLYKIFSKKKNRIRANNTSYYKDRNFTYTKESLENLW
jgi:hypothetical protein